SNSIYDFGTVHPFGVGNSLNLPTELGNIRYYEPDWRDYFDVAMDAKYLYIVWEEASAVPPGSPVTNYNIRLTAIDLETGLQATGFPKSVMLGRRPTVACDVRLNPASPTCDVASLNATFNISNITYFNLINTRLCYNGGLVGGVPITLPDSEVTPPFCSAIQYNFIDHARILVGSVAGHATPEKG